MNIDLLKKNFDIIIQLKSSDLFSFAEKLTKETAEEVEKRIKAENKLDELLTRKQVAKLFDVSLTTLHNWNNNRILSTIKIGKKVRYRRSDIEKLLADNKNNKK
jgi:excisionase family DNA binding protein